ncbi:MAG: lamin tail domain-containing protein, partial [Halobacteria archaeon]|nr:lamin tail domain-containing protein [Halobacteria archaeon]
KVLNRRVVVERDELPQHPVKKSDDLPRVYLYLSKTLDGVVRKRSVNYMLIKNGYAGYHGLNTEQADELQYAERVSRDSRRNRCGNVTTTRSETETEAVPVNSVKVLVKYDPEGDDGQNLREEFVTLWNSADEEINLTGWTIEDGDGNRYSFPDGYVLSSGSSVNVHTGYWDTVHDSAYSHLPWGAGKPVWDNEGDTVVVRDTEGDVVATRTYRNSS